MDIVNEILLRCPVKSLLRFKCACKNWYALIKTPDFVQQHLKKKNHSSTPNLLVYDYDIDDCSMTFISETENSQTFQGMKYLIGYVDGLFLMYGYMNSVLSCALLNPASREMRRFPGPLPMMDRYPYFGLGIDPLTNDFKVVNFFHPPCDLAAVYSCRRDSWRIFKIEDFHKPQSVFDLKCTYGNAYLNGNYYWLLTRNHISSILLFNFRREMFEEIEGPDPNVREYADGMMLLDESIAILNLIANPRFYYDLWVMIQPGVWNKLITFQCFPYFISFYDTSFIIVSRASRLFSYNVRTNKTRHLGFQHSRLRIDGAIGDGGCGVSYYKKSLITIKQQEDGELDHY
ncbi:hypothetical protein H5410_042013 [Solanum commersonii]|uniref:F-box domain-containing protein n=1 Tax=Solanum commersonii TaxID=4109 RepID=A0A9J5XT53_SOLCO|nr:hypothetical protein H5410_042013 [Solanum commersonii]